MGFVHHLAELRTVRGEIISLRDLRYVDNELGRHTLEGDVEKATLDRLRPLRRVSCCFAEALDPYQGTSR